jgi:hypothetical protein
MGVFHYRQNTGRRGGVSYGTPGAPDIVIVFDGVYIGLEIKQPGKKLSEKQKEFKDKLLRAGGEWWTVDRFEQLLLFLGEKCQEKS